MAVTITQGMEIEFLGSGQIRPDLSSIGPLLIPAGSVDHPANPIGIADFGMGALNPPQSNLTGTWGSSWAPFVAGTTTDTVYASTDAVVAFIDSWQKSWIVAQMAGLGLATGYNVVVTGADLVYDPGSGNVHLGTSYSSGVYWFTSSDSLSGSVGTSVAYQWDNVADVPTLTVWQLDGDGGISIVSQTAIDQSDWPTYAGLFDGLTGGAIDSMDDIFVLYLYPAIASISGYVLGQGNGLSGFLPGPQPGGGFIAIGGPILSPHPAPLPHPPTDVGTDYPTAPIGPPGYPGPYLPGYPIEYPEGYSSDQPLPGFPAYKQMLRGADVTSVINGFFVNMTQVLQLFADRGDSNFLRQEAVDMNGNSITNMAPATTNFELVTLAQVKAA